MLRTLLESNAAPTRRRGGILISIGLHTAVIALAVTATARATIHRDPIEQPAVIAVVAPPSQTEHRTKVQQPSTERHCCLDILPGKVIVPPVTTPDNLPPIDVGRVASHDDFCVACARGGLVDRGELTARLTSANDLYDGTMVERAAMPRSDNPAPVYPSSLRSAQIEGSVMAHFIVDTTGRAEPASISIIEATHAQFGEAVRQALLRSRYQPAMIGERKVRQLVEQRFAFSLVR